MKDSNGSIAGVQALRKQSPDGPYKCELLSISAIRRSLYRRVRKVREAGISGVRLYRRANQEDERPVDAAFVCKSAKRRRSASELVSDVIGK